MGAAALPAAGPHATLIDEAWTVWSVTPGFRIDALAPEGPVTIEARRLVVALGRRPLPTGGETPETDVLRLLGAPHRFDPAQHAWLPVLDGQGWTGIPGLYATPAPPCAPPPWPAIVAALPDDAVVCACEGITRAAIEAAAVAGAREVNQLKHFTRCGMGICQGRDCEELVAELLAPLVGGREAAGRWTIRPPLRPVPLDTIIGAFSYDDIPVPAPAPL